MSYASQKRTRRRKLQVTQVDTAYGKLWKLLRFLGLKKLAIFLLRRPWHIADEYVNGYLNRPILIYPKARAARDIERLNQKAAEQAGA